jgi:hypothetical protein
LKFKGLRNFKKIIWEKFCIYAVGIFKKKLSEL